jgi:hypothetical protein
MMKNWQTCLLPFGVAIISAIAADWLFYALGIGTMHSIGTFRERVWMGNMTHPGWSFLIGLVGFAATSAWILVRGRFGIAGAIVPLALYLACFLPLCRFWFCNPRFHDSMTQPAPGWMLRNGEQRKPEPSTAPYSEPAARSLPGKGAPFGKSK